MREDKGETLNVLPQGELKMKFRCLCKAVAYDVVFVEAKDKTWAEVEAEDKSFRSREHSIDENTIVCKCEECLK